MRERIRSWPMVSALMAFIVVVIGGCSAGVSGPPATSLETTSTTAPTSTTSTASRVPIGGQLVKLDPLTLDPRPGLDPIAMGLDSWNWMSTDGTHLINFGKANRATTIDVHSWETVGDFSVSGHAGMLVEDGELFTYHDLSGGLTSTNIVTGGKTLLAEWPKDLWLWDGLHSLSGGRIAALGAAITRTEVANEHVLFIYETITGETRQIPLGLLERVNASTGFFDGDYEIPEIDSPGVVWSEDRLLIVFSEGPEIIEVDIESGAIETHLVDLTSWWDRLWAFWVPTASAKGPGLGTYSSGALSPDGQLLYISGNRLNLRTEEDGSPVEESEHLGLIVVDTDTWEPLESPDLPIQFVRQVPSGVIGVDNTSTHSWLDDYYLFTSDDERRITYIGPITVDDGGCQLTLDESHLLCSEFLDSGQEVTLIDLDTAETVASLTIGHEDYVHPNGVLENWNPRSDP